MLTSLLVIIRVIVPAFAKYPLNCPENFAGAKCKATRKFSTSSRSLPTAFNFEKQLFPYYCLTVITRPA